MNGLMVLAEYFRAALKTVWIGLFILAIGAAAIFAISLLSGCFGRVVANSCATDTTTVQCSDYAFGVNTDAGLKPCNQVLCEAPLTCHVLLADAGFANGKCAGNQ